MYIYGCKTKFNIMCKYGCEVHMKSIQDEKYVDVKFYYTGHKYILLLLKHSLNRNIQQER